MLLLKLPLKIQSVGAVATFVRLYFDLHHRKAMLERSDIRPAANWLMAGSRAGLARACLKEGNSIWTGATT